MEIELSARHSHTDRDRELPPTDRGKDAWLFLAACFTLEALIWGFNFSFGIFQDYYSTHEPFKGSTNIAVIGTCAMGFSYVFMPVAFGVLVAFPRLRRWAAPFGFLIMCCALAFSSFATTTTQLIVSQGVSYGIGASIAYAPTIIFLDDWFVRRKGLAFGIMWAGTGLSGVILPIVLQWLINTYGYQTTLRVWALVLLIMPAPLLYFVKPRVPIAATSTARPFNLSFLLDRVFLVYQLGNIIEALGYFLPAIYLPTYARTLGATGLTASLTLILVNLASVAGCIIMGTLVDRYHATTCILISTIGSTLAVFFLWGFSTSLAPLYIFCIAYGAFAGSFSSTWPAILTEVRKSNHFTDTGIVFGFLSTGRGIGNVVSGPLSESLLSTGVWKGSAGAYGNGYGSLIVFTGITAFVGGLSVVARQMRLV